MNDHLDKSQVVPPHNRSSFVKKLNLISRSISFEEIRWDTAIALITGRYNLNPAQVKKAIGRLSGDLMEPLGLRWSINPALRPIEVMIFNTLLEVNGCDELVIKRAGVAYRLGLSYLQEFSFVKTGEQDTFFSREGLKPQLLEVKFNGLALSFKFYNLKIKISSRKNALLFYSLISCLAIAFVVPALFLIIYCLAVFTRFLEDPQATTFLAVNNFTVGLALLSFLTGVSALFGILVRRLKAMLAIPGSRVRSQAKT